MGIKKHSEITDDKKTGHTYLLARLIILKVVFAYINVIVEQGKGIVTSLEHLKYFFLYNTNKQEGLYGYNFKQIDPKARFYHRQENAPLDATTWKSNYQETLSGTDAYAHITGSGYDASDKFYEVDLLNQTSIYHRPVYLKDLDKYILERVNKGSINRVKMLRNLIYFGQQCSLKDGNFPESSDTDQCQFIEFNEEEEKTNNITLCKEKDIFDLYKSKPASQIKALYPYVNALLQKKRENEEGYNKEIYESFSSLNIIPEGPKGGALNTYIMMAHIMRGVFQRDGYVDLTDRGKYSDATIATLEFAQSIKSDVGVCKPVSQVISYNRYNPTYEISTENCLDYYQIENNFMDRLDSILHKPNTAGGAMIPVTCSYKVISQPDFENMYKVLRLVDTKKFSNNKFYGNVNNYLRILNKDGSIKSKKNIMNITNRLRSKRRSLKSPSRFLVKHYRR